MSYYRHIIMHDHGIVRWQCVGNENPARRTPLKRRERQRARVPGRAVLKAALNS